MNWHGYRVIPCSLPLMPANELC